MEAQPLIVRPIWYRRRIDPWRLMDFACPLLVVIYFVAIVVLSISGVYATKTRVSDPDPSTSTQTSEDNLITLQQAYQTLQCHTQQQTATLLSLSPAGLLGADQVYAGNMLLGLGKLLVGTTALLTWIGFWAIDKEKYPLWVMDLLSLTGALTVVWLSWGGFDAMVWVLGGVYGVPGCPGA